MELSMGNFVNRARIGLGPYRTGYNLGAGEFGYREYFACDHGFVSLRLP